MCTFPIGLPPTNIPPGFAQTLSNAPCTVTLKILRRLSPVDGFPIAG
ncbi:hypothetical protein AsAng_0064570 (plasmid) [Aureispira anguillae]|uniref:Uncharacterized protein n=1 Tax=Aureispira anguillae TaxID=2864201 RepID=A0A915YLZ9_9BACT|nr:hypothetical protein AsAng_0064570 [Aureispira anguillae]